MKFILAYLFLIGISSFALAQSELLPIDERGKFIYYELVEAKGLLKDQLKERVNSFLKGSFKDLKLKTVQGDTIFVCTGKLIINKTLLVMSHPSGEIGYHFQAEVKEGKFRFWLSDFSFVPYQRDRYGNFVATSNKGIPLENTPSKLNSSQWKEYQAQTAKYTFQFAKEFKDHMASKASLMSPVKEKTIVKKEW